MKTFIIGQTIVLNQYGRECLGKLVALVPETAVVTQVIAISPTKCTCRKNPQDKLCELDPKTHRLLQDVLAATNIPIVERVPYNPEWYDISDPVIET